MNPKYPAKNIAPRNEQSKNKEHIKLNIIMVPITTKPVNVITAVDNANTAHNNSDKKNATIIPDTASEINGCSAIFRAILSIKSYIWYFVIILLTAPLNDIPEI